MLQIDVLDKKEYLLIKMQPPMEIGDKSDYMLGSLVKA